MDLRKIILKRLKALDWSVYDLAERSGLSCHRGTVYKYLRGERSITDPVIGEILDRLGLKIVEKRSSVRLPEKTPLRGRPQGSRDTAKRKKGSGIYPRKTRK